MFSEAKHTITNCDSLPLFAKYFLLWATICQHYLAAQHEQQAEDGSGSSAWHRCAAGSGESAEGSGQGHGGSGRSGNACSCGGGGGGAKGDEGQCMGSNMSI